MYGIYLKCDNCVETIGGEDVTAKQQGIPTLTRRQRAELRSLAAELGWLYLSPYQDLCPGCSASMLRSFAPAPG